MQGGNRDQAPPYYNDAPPSRGGSYYPRSPNAYEHEPRQRGRRSEDRGFPAYQDGGRGPPPRRGYRSRSRSPRGGFRTRGPPPDRHRGRFDDQNKATPSGSKKAVAQMEPMDTYKVFIMRQDDNAAPETYQQRYEEYKKKYTQRLMRAFFEDHKREEWMQERYSPAIRHRAQKQQKQRQVAAAKALGERLRNGTTKINLDEDAMSSVDNDLEDGARVLYVRRIPCACPVSTLHDAIKKFGGDFESLHLSDPAKKAAVDFDRSAYIIYATAEEAKEALPKLHNAFVQDGDNFPPIRLQVSPHRARAPLKTPSYLSVPSRLTHDLQQALKLAQTLDAVLYSADNRSQLGIDALLEDDKLSEDYSSDKSKLDLTIAYLRRVHYYVYYGGSQCRDMGDILHSHPALFCRPEATAKDLNAEGQDEMGGWASSLDDKVSAYISHVEETHTEEAMDKEKALVNEIERKEEEALENTYKNYGEQAGEDGKHRCRLCKKLFRALDFVKKHIRNKHPELVVDKIAEVGESFMWDQFREDDERPMPPLETTNNAPAPTLGRPKRDASPFRGRGAPRERRESPRRDLPVDPRSVTRSYQDLDDLKDAEVELSFDALESLPPPKKKAKA